MNFFSRKTETTTAVFDAPTTAIDDITGDYTIDASHSRLGFVARHAMVTKVRGQFRDFEGTAHVDAATPPESTVDLTIQVASVDTGSADRDGHLKSADFFDAETYPTITFVSTDVKRDGSDWTVTGDLTIKDVTKPVTIDFEETGSAQDPFGNAARRLRGRDHHQPQGLGPHLERRARDRRRPRLREDQARVRRLGDQVTPEHRRRSGTTAVERTCPSGAPPRRTEAGWPRFGRATLRTHGVGS